MSTLTSTQLQQQYIAYFGRPGDPAGINYWLSSTSGISSAREFADKIYAQDEYKKSTVGDKSVEEQVNSIYVNLFGRQADAAGLLYWTAEIESGNLQLSNVAFDLIWAASNPTSGNSAQATLDATALSNKVAAAESFTNNLKTDIDGILAYQAESTSPWISGSAFASAVTFIKSATATNAPVAADVTAAVTSMISSGTSTSAAASTTLKLTSTTDALVGGAGDDAASGVLQGNGTAGNGTGTTVAPGDSIDGKAGTDTFTISVAGDAGALYTLSAVQLDNVEKVFLSNFDSDTTANGTVVEGDLMTGVTTVGLSSSSANGDTVFNGLKNKVDAEMRNGAGDLKLTYDGSYVVTGTADTQKLTVSSLTGGTFDAAGIETLNIHSELAKSTITATTFGATSSLETVNVTGDKDLKNSTALIFAKTANGTTAEGFVDASAFTGKLTVDVSGSASTVDVKGGTGNDTIKFAATLTKNDVVDGGAGTDTLSMTSATLSDQLTGVTNVETFAFDYISDTAVAMDVSKLPASVTKVQVDLQDNVDTTNATIDSTITNLGSQTVVLKHSTADDADANNNDGNKVTITAASDTSADAINVTLDAIGTYTAANFGYAELDVANYETVNINAVNDTAGTVTTAEVAKSTVTSATSMVVTGNANTTLGNITGGAMTSFDASALTGTLSADFDSADKVTIKGSATKANTFTMNATANQLDNNDTIVGGSATTDSLAVELSGATATTGALNISAIETLKLNTSGTNTLDFTNVTGAKKVELEATKQTITGFPLATTIVSSDAATSVKITAADSTGSSDTLKLHTEIVDTARTNTVEAKGIETLALTLDDGNLDSAVRTITYALTKFEGTTVTATQDATAAENSNIALGTLHKNVTTIDTTGTKGTQSASLASATSAGTIKLGGGGAASVTGTAYGDTFTIAKTGHVDHTVNGGGGTDTITITADSGFDDPSLIDVETVTIDVVPGNVDLAILNNKNFHTTTTKIYLTGGNSLSSFKNESAGEEMLDGVTIFDASAFGGTVELGVADDKFDDTVTITGTSGSKDTVTTDIAVAGTDKPKTIGIEEFLIGSSLAIDGTAVVDLTNTTGLTKVTATDVGADDTLQITNATNQSVKITDTAAATSVIEYKLKDATGSSDAVTFEIKEGTTFTAGTQLKTTDIETVTVKASSAESISLANLSMATTGETMKLVVTGDKALTVSAMNADVTTIDASGMSEGGSIVQTGRTSVKAATYTGSDGDDTFQMKHADDVIVGGAGTNDTLVVTKNLILGGINVDLTKTADNITTFNGSSSATIQSGFESVDLSAVTGSFGAEITAIKGGSTITGTPNIDEITLGAGTDVVFQTHATSDVLFSFTAGATSSDVVHLDFSALGTQLMNLDESVDINSNTVTPVLGAITGDTTFVDGTPATDANILVVNPSGNIASTDALETSLESGGGTDIKMGGAVTSGDVIVALYDDGTHSYLAKVTFGAVNSGSKPGSGTLTAVNLFKFDGISDVASFTADNFDFYS